MPFDIPEYLDFDVDFEPTSMHDKKYVINKTLANTLVSLVIFQVCITW